MGQHLLSVRILFHATFVFVYLPITGLAFTGRLITMKANGHFLQTHFDGITALSALVGLGIFAALDILTVRRKVNQRAFLIIEIIVVILMPLSMWPIIVASIWVIWLSWVINSIENMCSRLSWFCNTIFLVGRPISGDEITSAFVVAAAIAILGLSAGFLLYIVIAAVTDQVRGNKFLPIYPGYPYLSAPGPLNNWYLWGNQRTPTERGVMVSRCTNYIFRHSVFRKHTFEPTIWAIFRGIIAVYSCVGLVVFSAYSALSEAQLRGTLTVHETVIMASPYAFMWGYSELSVASFLMGQQAASDANPNSPVSVTPEQNPPPTLSGNNTSGDWQNPMPRFWTFSIDGDIKLLPNFNISWTGEYALVTWVTTDACWDGTNVGTAFLNATEFKSTNPLVLAPFQQYRISLISVQYILPSCSFTQWIPDVIRSVDSGSGSAASIAIFSFNGYQPQVLVRDFRPPSMFSSIAHILSAIGGTLSFIDGLFALVFGRTIVAIMFGTRIVSPFGLLGMVTHNRFKRLIKEHYPLMQEDIERGGMAAYISEVAIDAALMDTPAAKGSISSVESSLIGNTEEGVDSSELWHRQTGSSVSHLRLPYAVEELGDLDTIPLVGRQTDHE